MKMATFYTNEYKYTNLAASDTHQIPAEHQSHCGWKYRQHLGQKAPEGRTELPAGLKVQRGFRGDKGGDTPRGPSGTWEFHRDVQVGGREPLILSLLV